MAAETPGSLGKGETADPDPHAPERRTVRSDYCLLKKGESKHLNSWVYRKEGFESKLCFVFLAVWHGLWEFSSPNPGSNPSHWHGQRLAVPTGPPGNCLGPGFWSLI